MALEKWFSYTFKTLKKKTSDFYFELFILIFKQLIEFRSKKFLFE